MTSSDRTHDAVRYIRRCGYEVPYMNVSVLQTGQPIPDSDGNALVEQPPTDGKGYGYSLTMSWEGPVLLRLERDDGLKLKKSEAAVGEVAIAHRLERQLNP